MVRPNNEECSSKEVGARVSPRTTKGLLVKRAQRVIQILCLTLSYHALHNAVYIEQNACFVFVMLLLLFYFLSILFTHIFLCREFLGLGLCVLLEHLCVCVSVHFVFRCFFYFCFTHRETI